MIKKCSRNEPRKALSEDITFTVQVAEIQKPDRGVREHTGVLVDCSSSGVGLMINHRVDPGSQIELAWFGERRAGVVMWSVNTGDRYRIGVRFAQAS